ncbi:MAG: EutN/CcmL family microcompartment protein [Deltaproteobacteria bacterium]|nr:EutN/CcmL family microcompartment protein [Deltaproteobacteria bacterium]
MILAKVISRVVSTAKLDSLPHRPLLEVQALKEFGDPGTPLIAIDCVQAGPGDLVILMQEGTGARQAALPDPKAPLPAQMVVVGIVDEVTYASTRGA